MLEGVDSYHRRVSEGDQPQWDFNAIQTHDTLLLFVMNLAYTVDPVHQVFQFTDRRETFVFPHLGAIKPDWQMWRLTREGMENVNLSGRKKPSAGKTRSVLKECMCSLLIRNWHPSSRIGEMPLNQSKRRWVSIFRSPMRPTSI